MAICRWAGYPDLFLTFTCNAKWPEITRFTELMNLSPSCRPDILSRVFKMKLNSLMRTIKDERIFGSVRAEVYTIEFQKRGLPHAHILLFLEPKDKITRSEQIDEIISCEIPDPNSAPRLHQLVKRFMIHGPCGDKKKKAPCMKDKKCSKYYPRPFTDTTSMDDEGYPTYRRRNDGRHVKVSKHKLDNRFVVPYSPVLLQKFEAHINIEKCNQSTAIKYLFKYISKGHDRVVAGLFDRSKKKNKCDLIDEVQHYYNCRYISACEGSWRILGFDIHRRFPPVERLSFHLPNQQFVFYTSKTNVHDLVDQPRVCESQFLSWMKMNKKNKKARTLTYQEFPKHFVYDRKEREWKIRKKGFAIGRISHAHPSSGELYYMRILLTKIKGPTSFEDIRSYAGKTYKNFREACLARGLLKDDNEFVSAIKEAATWTTGNSIRRLFVSMLLSSCLHRPEQVWERCSTYLSEDLLHVKHSARDRTVRSITAADKENLALQIINDILMENGKRLEDYKSLPQLPDSAGYDLKCVYDHVMKALLGDQLSLFFVHGYGGTGKTFLWNALATTLRARGEIVLTVASSGIAATLLPTGRTAHSRFAIPIDVEETSTCSIGQGTPLAELLKVTKLIIWDEAPMVKRYCLEALDRTLRDIMHCNMPFGGKCIVLGGDFRQILPVVPRGGRAAIVDACINSSYLWRDCKIFHLTQNMRLTAAITPKAQEQLRNFASWLLSIGDGKVGKDQDGLADIEIPSNLLVRPSSNPISSLVSETYCGLLDNLESNDYFNDRAILAPTIAIVDELNKYMLSLLPGKLYTYSSCDSICKSTQDNDGVVDLYTTEFLNAVTSSGMPPHKLSVKVGALLMLIRNIDQSSGLCNGTRLRVTKLGKSVIEAITLNGSHPNEKVLIHRMDMNPSDSRLPFKMRRRQFPIILSFAMTINKSQGQSLKYVGLHLSKPVFSHGQLYVALSRVRSIDGLNVFVQGGDPLKSACTANVVYKEVFRNLQSDA